MPRTPTEGLLWKQWGYLAPLAYSAILAKWGSLIPGWVIVLSAAGVILVLSAAILLHVRDAGGAGRAAQYIACHPLSSVLTAALAASVVIGTAVYLAARPPMPPRHQARAIPPESAGIAPLAASSAGSTLPSPNSTSSRALPKPRGEQGRGSQQPAAARKSSEPTAGTESPSTKIKGSENTYYGIGPVPTIHGNGNTIVGGTDSHGNTIITQPGTSIGDEANGGPNGIAIGAHAGARQAPQPAPQTSTPPQTSISSPASPYHELSQLCTEIQSQADSYEGRAQSIPRMAAQKYSYAQNSRDEEAQRQQEQVQQQIASFEAAAYDDLAVDGDIWIQAAEQRITRLHDAAIAFMEGSHTRPLTPNQVIVDSQAYSYALRSATTRPTPDQFSPSKFNGDRFQPLANYCSSLQGHLGDYPDTQ